MKIEISKEELREILDMIKDLLTAEEIPIKKKIFDGDFSNRDFSCITCYAIAE